MPNRKTRNRMKNRKSSSLNSKAKSFQPLRANAKSFKTEDEIDFDNLSRAIVEERENHREDEMDFDNLSRAIVEERRRHTKKSKGGKKNKRKTRKMRR